MALFNFLRLPLFQLNESGYWGTGIVLRPGEQRGALPIFKQQPLADGADMAAPFLWTF